MVVNEGKQAAGEKCYPVPICPPPILYGVLCFKVMYILL